jgi:DNA-binding CsgD family transcriptional regulator
MAVCCVFRSLIRPSTTLPNSVIAAAEVTARVSGRSAEPREKALPAATEPARCGTCGADLLPEVRKGRRGQPARYCSNACRQRAYRRRTAELAAEKGTGRAAGAGSAARRSAAGSVGLGSGEGGAVTRGSLADHAPGDRRPDPSGGAESPRVWRERQVVSLVAQGLTNSQIARHVGASVRTVGADIAAACRRRGLRSRAQLAAWTAARNAAAASRRTGFVAQPQPERARLSPRQAEVVSLVADGLTNEEIAQSLQVSPRTVASHLAMIFGKLGVRSRSELAVWSFDQAAYGPTGTLRPPHFAEIEPHLIAANSRPAAPARADMSVDFRE